MNNREKSERYGELISNICPTAAAIGRREPYHLTYLKKYRGILPQPAKTGCGEMKGNAEKCNQDSK